MSNGKKLQLSFNSPVILGFTIACFAVLVIDKVTGGTSTSLLFSVYRSSLLSPLTYLRFFGHVLGHAGWEHFIGNIMMILVVGPLLEEKYGSSNMLFVILATALVTGIVNFIFFPHTQLLGASGVVFALILLASFTSFKEGKVPVTFLLVAILYIGEQVYDGIFIQDNVSNLTHILGGAVGSGLGFVMNKNKMNRYWRWEYCMLEHKKIQSLGDYFVDLNSRQNKGVYFYRINGYSEEISEFIKKYYDVARRTGVVIEGKIPNPDEKNLAYYGEIMGMNFQMSIEFISTSLKKWLPRMNDFQRQNVSASIYDSLDTMRKAGKTENMLKNAVVVDESELPNDVVSVGSIVKVKDYDFDEEVEYSIVGSAEADPMNFKISNESPVGSALVGKKVGDIVEVSVPDGINKFEVLGIRRD